jgi:hypothetical protein
MLLAACQALSGDGVFVPQYRPLDQRPAGLHYGVLTVEDGCIWIASGGSRWLALWPTTISVSTGQTVVVAQDGLEVREGDPITVGGGEYGTAHFDFVEDLIGQTVPDECREMSWLVTELLPENWPEQSGP